MSAQVTRAGFLSMQVCIPKDWTDDQAKTFAEAENPCGTTHGWHVRKQGDPALVGCDERVTCQERDGHVHLMLDA